MQMDYEHVLQILKKVPIRQGFKQFDLIWSFTVQSTLLRSCRATQLT